VDAGLAAGVRVGWRGCLALLVPLLAAVALAAPDSAPAQGIDRARAERVAGADPNAVQARHEHRDLTTQATQVDGGNWEVGFFAGGEQLVQVVVNGASGEVEESWTGEQVAWKMARGYEGAFGRTVNAPYIWIPLCALFALALVDWRRPLRIEHLDLLVVVAGFGLSHYFFNRGEIGVSVPLAYPPLLYLLVRALWMGFRGGGGLSPSLPLLALAAATLLLVGFRVVLNLADSNVIDVGYSGVIGADLIVDGEPLYGNFPSDNHAGDTYGPLAYYAYVPFEQALTWGGRWDGLPAAHAAAIFFDLATLVGLFVLGRRLRPGEAGTRLGVILAFAWAACPYTTFALESNSNDSLVAALLVGAMLVLTSVPARGVLLALASATKFAPLALAPLFATYGARWEGAREGLAGLLRVAAPFALAFALTLAIVMAQTLIDPGLETFWDRSIGSQAGRDSPFSIWGQVGGLEPLQTALKIAVAGLALLVAFLPRRRDPVTVAALGAAVLIAVQLTVEHWFYLYLPWFLPLLLVAIATARRPAPAGG
jgi:hypothetical protein